MVSYASALSPSALPYSNLADRGGLAGFEVELTQVLAHEMDSSQCGLGSKRG